MINFITKIAIFFITALLCMLAYNWTSLNQVFKIELNYLQWLAVELIINLLIVGPLLNQHKQKKNDSKGSKISFDLP
jgi:surface polysaccharide O-acyltransferase-like enzyme